MWTAKIHQAFNESNKIITDAIRSVVQTFDLRKLTKLIKTRLRLLSYAETAVVLSYANVISDCCTTG